MKANLLRGVIGLATATSFFYALQTLPQPGLNGRRGYVPRGRGLGGSSLINAMIAIGVSAAPKFIRLTRGQVLAVKSEDYVQSARALGA